MLDTVTSLSKPCNVPRFVLHKVTVHTHLRAVITVILKVKIFNGLSSEFEIAKV